MDAQTFADHARPIHSDDRELQFKEVLSFHASEKVLQRRFNRAGWIAGTIGAVLGLAGVGAVVVLLPLKQTVVKWIEVDTSTGWVGEVAGAADAPKMFSGRVADHVLRQYIEAREGYVPETDQVHWDTVRVMSSADEMENYKAWRKTELSPVRQLALGGHVDVFNFNPDRLLKGTNETYSCTVRFDRRLVKGATIGRTEHWVATVDFQWHPEMTMTTQDVQVNYAGMQVIAYKAEQQ